MGNGLEYIAFDVDKVIYRPVNKNMLTDFTIFCIASIEKNDPEKAKELKHKAVLLKLSSIGAQIAKRAIKMPFLSGETTQLDLYESYFLEPAELSESVINEFSEKYCNRIDNEFVKYLKENQRKYVAIISGGAPMDLIKTMLNKRDVDISSIKFMGNNFDFYQGTIVDFKGNVRGGPSLKRKCLERIAREDGADKIHFLDDHLYNFAQIQKRDDLRRIVKMYTFTYNRNNWYNIRKDLLKMLSAFKTAPDRPINLTFVSSVKNFLEIIDF